MIKYFIEAQSIINTETDEQMREQKINNCLNNATSVGQKISKETKKTNKRYGATNIPSLEPFDIDFISGDETFATAAANVNLLTEQAKAGEISGAELKEILEDMQRQLSIINEMSQLEFKEKLNTVLNGLITIAAAV